MGPAFLNDSTITVTELKDAAALHQDPEIACHLVTQPVRGVFSRRRRTGLGMALFGPSFRLEPKTSPCPRLRESLATLVGGLDLYRAAEETLSASEGEGVSPQAVAQERLAPAKELGRKEGLEVTLSRLGELLNEPETDDYGIARPTTFAYETAVGLLRKAAELMHFPFPRGSAAVDHEGGIGVTWMKGDRQLHLLVPASAQKQCMVYFYAGKDRNLDPLPPGSEAARILANWLERLCKGRTSGG